MRTFGFGGWLLLAVLLLCDLSRADAQEPPNRCPPPGSPGGPEMVPLREKDFEPYLAEYIRSLERGAPAGGAERLNYALQFPAEAERLIVPLLRHARPDVRNLALRLLRFMDTQKYLEHFVDAVEREPNHEALMALEKTSWSETNRPLQDRARAALRRYCEQGTDYVPDTLVTIGKPEDVAAIRIGLTRLISREIPLTAVEENAEDLARRGLTTAGLPTYREMSIWMYRGTLARLGDPDQIEFFRQRLLAAQGPTAQGKELERAVDYAQNIARPELVDALRPLLDRTDNLGGGCIAPYSLATMACSALRAIFPGVSSDRYDEAEIRFWKDWLAQRTAGARIASPPEPAPSAVPQEAPGASPLPKIVPAMADPSSKAARSPTAATSDEPSPAAAGRLALPAAVALGALAVLILGARTLRRRLRA